MIHDGVYIGTDCEFVVAENYMITYRRSIHQDFLESRLFKMENGEFSCIGICQSSPIETEQHIPPKLWKSAFVYGGEISTKQQLFQEGQQRQEDCPPIYTNMLDETMKVYIGSSVNIESEEEQVFITFEDGMTYSTIIDEVFTAETLHPSLPNICHENIGECLRLWNMGINEEISDINEVPTFIGVIVNTSKHMYIFEMTPNSIYCRAARFVATNQGVVFNQNFRQGFEAYMIKDNSDACLPLPIEESQFSSSSCVWNNRSVYWSVVSYNDTEITLNGCQGDIYCWVKPNR